MQVWLQEVAWTEAEMPQRTAERNSQAEGQHCSTHVVRREPMFNFEVTLKLIKWCSLTYSTLGQDGCLENQWTAEQPTGGLVRGSMHRPLEPPTGTAFLRIETCSESQAGLQVVCWAALAVHVSAVACAPKQARRICWQ